MPLLKTGATHYHTQSGLPDKGCAIKGLVVLMAFNHIIMLIVKQDLVKKYNKIRSIRDGTLNNDTIRLT